MNATARSTIYGGRCIEYFDAYLIGLTATPDNRTYGFFRKNVVSEYGHEQAVADGVNVGNEIYHHRHRSAPSRARRSRPSSRSKGANA